MALPAGAVEVCFITDSNRDGSRIMDSHSNYYGLWIMDSDSEYY